MCEASVSLGIAKCKISSQKLFIFWRVGLGGDGGRGGGEGVEKSLGLRIVFTLCTPSTHTRTLKMDAQHKKRQKIIEQITKTCKTSRDNINLPLETVKAPYRFNSSFFKGTTFYDVLTRLSI